MIIRATMALSILFCTWASTGQANLMQAVYVGDKVFASKRLGPIAPSLERELCISPCFAKGLRAYISGFVLAPRAISPVVLFNFNPKTKPGPGPGPGPGPNPSPTPVLLFFSPEPSVKQVPVPATLPLLALGLVGLIWSRREKLAARTGD